MTNLIFPKWKAAQQKATAPDISDAAVNVKAVLVDLADYTYSATHEFLSDVPSGARVATSGNMATKTVASADGTFDVADFIFASVTGDQSEAVIFYVDTGTPSTSRLMYLFDTGVTGLPVTPNGADINVTINVAGLVTP